MRQHARFIGVSVLLILGAIGSSGDAEQFSCTGDVAGTVAIGKEAIVADAMQAFWQDVDQETANVASG